MNMKEVKQLIQEILQSDISEFELEHTGTKVRLRRGFGTNASIGSPVAKDAITSQPALRGPVGSSEQESLALATPDSVEDDLHFITSPIVGTLYHAPSPDAEPFVKVGDMVEEGAILCIVEAMKLMNEIPSDVAGELVRVYVQNNQAVEFGQKLFSIRPRTRA